MLHGASIDKSGGRDGVEPSMRKRDSCFINIST